MSGQLLGVVSRRRMAYLLVGLFAIVLVLGAPQSPVAAQEGWVIERFNATYDIQADGSVQVSERIEVDFRSLRRNGIFRDLLIEQEYDAESNRIYRVQVQSVASAIGERRTFRLFDRDPFLRIRIGDEARLVTGRETYVISYRLEGALNGFDDHDELFWNVLGFDWPVPINETRVTVTAPEGFQRAACFQGRRGSTQPCNVEDLSSAVIHFASTRGYKSGENMTIIASIDKGIVDDPKPILEDKPRQFPVGYFVFEPLSSVAALLVVLGGFGFVGWVWYSTGRDRRYTTTHYLTGDTDEAIGPLFGQDQVVVEYTPPEGLLPGEIGLLIDERVDTKDVTATIIDLAVRGYLEIEEVEPKWLLANFFGTGKDWTLKKKREADDLKLYERTVFKGLFKAGATSVELSDLKTKFHTTLEKAQKQLYKAATRDGWFRGNPSSTRTRWRGIGGGLFVAGLLTALGLGWLFGAGTVGIGLALVGVAAYFTAGWMPARTAKGSEILRRIKGFELYIETAESRRQEFNEKANIFAEYLPYAIVFGCVDRWAKAFEGIDTTQYTSTWYHGAAPFYAVAFASHLTSFNTSIGTTIASTPGGSGGSGFGGGGFSGGGGGGGGGGSWSDRSMKRNIAPVDLEGLLEKVERLPIETWSYKEDGDLARHLGPMAQDFRAAFGLGESDRWIENVDAIGVSLAAIKALCQRIDVRDGEIAALQRRIESLEKDQAKQE